MSHGFEELTMGIVSGLFSVVPSSLFGIALYVLSSMGLYTIAQRRGLAKPWLAWIPVANSYLVGSLSDQYRYIVYGENKSKRKVLLTLSILTAVLGLTIAIAAIVITVNAVMAALGGFAVPGVMDSMVSMVIGILGVSLPLAGVSIAYAVIRFMALYDIYKSVDPANCVVYLVLSILCHVTEPFFLFFNRNRDEGMPPRKEQYTAQENAWQPTQERPEPWQQSNADRNDYL